MTSRVALLEELRSGAVDFDSFARCNRTYFKNRALFTHRKWKPWPLTVDDLVQEAMIAAWRAVDSWEPGRSSIGARVDYCVRNALIDECRRALRWPKRGSKPNRDVLGLDVENMHSAAPTQEATTFARLACEEKVESIKSDFARDVFVATVNGFKRADIARAIYADKDRRAAYKLPSYNRTRVLCRPLTIESSAAISNMI